MSRSLTVMSVFSGAGGLDYGFHSAGHQLQCAVELRKNSSATLAHNLKLPLNGDSTSLSATETPVVLNTDIRTVDFTNLRDANFDVLTGGPPCQDFTIIRRRDRRGIHTDRGVLYLEYLRALAHAQPKLFVFENVQGLLTANNYKAYPLILHDMQHLNELHPQAIGYTLLFNKVINSAHVGVPQERKRLIIIGIRNDLIGHTNVDDLHQLVAKTLDGDKWLFKRFPLTAFEAFEGKPLYMLQDRYCAIVEEYCGIANEVGTAAAYSWHKRIWEKLTFNVVSDYCKLHTGKTSHRDFDAAMQEHEDLLKQLGWLGVNVRDVADEHNQIKAVKDTLHERLFHIPFRSSYRFVAGSKWAHSSSPPAWTRYARMSPLKPSPTVIASVGGRQSIYHYERSRNCLTLREHARLQTFPDYYDFKKPDIIKQIAEAVPPLLGERIATAISDVLAAL